MKLTWVLSQEERERRFTKLKKKSRQHFAFIKNFILVNIINNEGGGVIEEMKMFLSVQLATAKTKTLHPSLASVLSKDRSSSSLQMSS